MQGANVKSPIAFKLAIYAVPTWAACRPKIPATFYIWVGGGNICALGLSLEPVKHIEVYTVTNPYEFQPYHIKTVLAWRTREYKTLGYVPPPRLFFSSSFYSFFHWLTSMKYQTEDGINRHRPLMPTSHFLVSIEYQYFSNPKENASQTRPIKILQKINTVANTANGIRNATCVFVNVQLYELVGEIWSNWRDLGLMDGEIRDEWMKRQEINWHEEGGWIAQRKQQREQEV